MSCKILLSHHIEVWIEIPYKICLERNKANGHPVADAEITEAYLTWETPEYWEPWDEIWLHYDNPIWMGMYGEPSLYTLYAWDYDQKSPHHNFALGHHSTLVKAQVNKMSNGNINLCSASYIHDCGKPLTQTIDNNGYAKYYNHHNVGAYEAMFFDYENGADPLYISALVCYHMHPYFLEDSEEAMQKFIDKVGEDFMNDLMIIHRADENAKGETV